MVLLAIAAGSLLSEILIILAIFVLVYVIFKLGKFIIGILANSILGLISIFLVNSLFGLGIQINLLMLIIIAILGLPAVAIIILLKLVGII